jgi:hypothetical protein
MNVRKEIKRRAISGVVLSIFLDRDCWYLMCLYWDMKKMVIAEFS